MSRTFVPTLVAAILITATLFPLQVFGAPTPPPTTAGGGVVDIADKSEPESDSDVCATSRPGYARCHARVRTDAKVKAKVPARPGELSVATLGNGGAYDPAYLQSAYNLTAASSVAGAGQVVAIVDAFDAPNAEADL